MLIEKKIKKLNLEEIRNLKIEDFYKNFGESYLQPLNTRI